MSEKSDVKVPEEISERMGRGKVVCQPDPGR